MAEFLVFQGTIVHTLSLSQFELLEDANMVVDKATGKIQSVFKKGEVVPVEILQSADVIRLDGGKFICPGFIDTHTHAPQSVFAGTGHIPLLEWLLKYTFPTESKFTDLDFARDVYTKCVRRHLWSGTTTCCYYATIHTAASVLLGRIVADAGQRGFIGKVCMDRNAPDYYMETTESSIADTQEFVQQLQALGSPLLTPILTPRFAPTCTPTLMRALGDLAKEKDLPIQTHVSENTNEIAWVRDLHPECCSYTHVYQAHGLLTDRTILAHGIHLTAGELAMIKEAGASVSHCPNSNFSLDSGILDVRHCLSQGVKVSLGTDVAGGYSMSMLDAIRLAIVGSKSLRMACQRKFTPDSPAYQSHIVARLVVPASSSDDGKADGAVADFKQLTPEEAFYLATLGGSEAVGLQDRVGNFMPGKEFDALIIDPTVLGSRFDVSATDSAHDVFHKFLFCGDDRNIADIYVGGQRLTRK